MEEEHLVEPAVTDLSRLTVEMAILDVDLRGLGETGELLVRAFKKLHDGNAPLDQVIPDFVAARQQRYAGQRLRDLCAEMHDFYRKAGVSTLQAAQFRAGHLPELVMPPQRALQELVRNRVDYLPLDEMTGRIATTLWVVYPPGIATVIPGERLVEKARPMAANRFPGFENEVQGLYRETAVDGTIRFHTYVVRE